MYYKVGTPEYFEHREIVKREYEGYNEVPFEEQERTNKSAVALFKCSKCGGIYDMPLHNRLRNGQGCPYCAGKRLLKGYNDLQSKFPDIAKDWDYELNTEGPDEILAGSDKVVHWVCENGHKWATPCNWRTTSGNGCPKCNNRQTSFPERLIFRSFESEYNTISRYKIDGIEYDVYIPELGICIEYDGSYWHRVVSSKATGLNDKKHNKAKEKNLKFIRIIEENGYVCDDSTCSIKYIDGSSALLYTGELRRSYEIAYHLINKINDVVMKWCNTGISYNKSIYDTALADSRSKLIEHSLADDYPELMDEYSSKNKIDPHTIGRASDVMIIWECKNCHYEWKSLPTNRTNRGAGCPRCATEVRALARKYNNICKMDIDVNEKQRLFNEYIYEKGYSDYIVNLWRSKKK